MYWPAAQVIEETLQATHCDTVVEPLDTPMRREPNETEKVGICGAEVESL